MDIDTKRQDVIARPFLNDPKIHAWATAGIILVNTKVALLDYSALFLKHVEIFLRCFLEMGL